VGKVLFLIYSDYGTAIARAQLESEFPAWHNRELVALANDREQAATALSNWQDDQ